MLEHSLVLAVATFCGQDGCCFLLRKKQQPQRWPGLLFVAKRRGRLFVFVALVFEVHPAVAEGRGDHW
jgi:hypothetical protein